VWRDRTLRFLECQDDGPISQRLPKSCASRPGFLVYVDRIAHACTFAVKMIPVETFVEVRERFGHFASWAVWAKEGPNPKYGIDDLSILDPAQNPHLLETLHVNAIFLGLNISRRIERPLGNFHDPRPMATDFKIRFVLKETEYWGAYMTDIIKDFEEKASGKMMRYLRANQRFEKENAQKLREEIALLGVSDPLLVAFGKDAAAIANRNLGGEFRIRCIPHYACYVSKENYRQQVIEQLPYNS
jgi:hypothetical protein